LELTVTIADLQKARSNGNTQQWEIDHLTDELGKKTFLAQANLKKIVEKFREQTNAAIQVSTFTVSCRTAPDLCVSRVMTTGVLDEER
jgi:hypothetical protein